MSKQKKGKEKATEVKFSVYLQFVPDKNELISIRKDLLESTKRHLLNTPPWKIKIAVKCPKCGFITDVEPNQESKVSWYCRNCNGVIVYEI